MDRDTGATAPGFDVLGLGAVALDELLTVAAYPPADAKVRVERRERQCGGLAGTALVAAARLGASCAYAGTLGLDADSGELLENFVRENVSVAHVLRHEGAGPIRSTIVIGRNDATRTVLSYRGGFAGPDADWPPEHVIRTARVLLVDHVGLAGMIRAARVARNAGIPVVADLERRSGPEFSTLLDLVDHLIVGRAFAAELTGENDPARATEVLRRGHGRTVVVTCGADGCWAGDATHGVAHVPAFRVAVVDTTGCGDVFHGAYAAELARGTALGGRLRVASASAALKTTRAGNQAGIPTWEQVDEFLAAGRHRTESPYH